MYADDSNLACYDTNIKVLQDKLNYDLNQIHHWCLANRMAINTSKSKSMYSKCMYSPETCEIKCKNWW